MAAATFRRMTTTLFATRAHACARPRRLVVARLAALAACAAVALLTPSAPLAAQHRPASLAPGARVRLAAPPLGPRRVLRRVHVQRGDTLLLVPDRGARHDLGDTVTVALADVRQLEVSRGWRRRAIAGAFVGLALGVTAGAVHGHNRYDPGPRVCFILCKASRRSMVTRYALLGAYVGPPAGVFVGRFVLGDSWERLVPGTARVGVAPAAGGVRVGVRIDTP